MCHTVASKDFLASSWPPSPAAFSSIGAELLALVATETRNPRKLIPTAQKATWVRVVLFYFLAAFCVSIIVPSNESCLGLSSTAAASPYVIAIETAGIKVLPSLINACIVPSALSAGVSDSFTASRTLHAMAGSGTAPKILQTTDKLGCPWIAVLATWSLSLLAFLAIGCSSGKVFNYLVNLTALRGIITWDCIAITYFRFWAGMKALGISHSSLPWRSRFSVFGTYWILIVISTVLLVSGWPVFAKNNWNTATFFSNYLPSSIFTLVYVALKIGIGSMIVKASNMDLTTALREIEQRGVKANEQDELARTLYSGGKVKAFLKHRG